MKKISAIIVCLLALGVSFAYALPSVQGQAADFFQSLQTVEVPEPSHFLLALMGLIGLVAIKRK